MAKKYKVTILALSIALLAISILFHKYYLDAHHWANYYDQMVDKYTQLRYEYNLYRYPELHGLMPIDNGKTD